jgi:hypothetical protein
MLPKEKDFKQLKDRKESLEIQTPYVVEVVN